MGVVGIRDHPHDAEQTAISLGDSHESHLVGVVDLGELRQKKMGEMGRRGEEAQPAIVQSHLAKKS